MGKQSKAVLRPRSRKGKASSESQSSRSQPVLRSRSEIGAREEPEDEAEESEDGEQEGESGRKKVKRRRRVKRAKGESEEGKSKKVRRVRRRRSQREREEAKEEEEEEEDDEDEPDKGRSSSGQRPEVDADSVDLLRKLIRGVYERCAPDKLSKLPSIFEKYDGLEAEVYRKACRKYGVTPDIDLSRFEGGDAEKNTGRVAPSAIARNGSDRLQRDPASGPKPGSGGSWPFVEDYEGNSSCSSDEKIGKQDRRPPGSWQPKAWAPWSAPGYVTPGSWVPPKGTPGAWVPPVEAKATAPKLPSEAEKLDPDLKDLLFGRSHPMMPGPQPGPPPPGPPPGTSPFEPMHVPGQAGAPSYQSARQELQLEDFLGEWRDSMGHKVEVDWARNSSRGQLEVSLSKKGRDAIRLNVKQLSPGRFSCGHYQLEVEKSSPYKIVWEDRQKNKTSIWER